MRAYWISALFLLAGAEGASAQLWAEHNEPPDYTPSAPIRYDPALPTHKGPPPPSPYYSPEPAARWTGLYVGAHLGASFNSTLSGVAGIRAGYNYQVRQSVFGIESDASFRPYTTSSTSSATDATGTTYNLTSKAKANTISTLTGRYGYVYDRSTMMFVTAGVAYSAFGMGQTVTGVAGPNTGAYGANSSKGFRVGWTVGVGAEYALTRDWSLTGQYQYYQLPTSTLTTNAALGGATKATSVHPFSETGSLATMGLNYHF